MRFFKKKDKTAEEVRSDINDKEQENRAYRLSIEMRLLAQQLIKKAEQLEEALNNGGRS